MLLNGPVILLHRLKLTLRGNIMSFPLNPTDSQQYTNGLGTRYQYKAVDDAWKIVSQDVGVTGAQGSTGSQGVTGVSGVTGIIGVTGLVGVTGVQGNTGSQGNT